MRNVRFMVYINGSDVKLTLRPGQTLHHSQGGPTEEGWHCDSHSWTLTANGRELRREMVSDGVDCDGRLTHYQTAYASTDPRTFHTGYDAYKDRPKLFPYWKEESCRQYDQYAEMANY